AVGQVNGLAVFGGSNGMAEYAGSVLPIVAEVTPTQGKEGGRIIATGKLGDIAKEAVENISAVIKKFTLSDLSGHDIHLQYIGTYDGVEGDSASMAMATVILSALDEIPIRQDLAMTGSLNVRGMVLPIGGATAKLEGAADAGIKIALIPEENAKDVMIKDKYYDMMEIYTVRTIRDVLEYAFVDCPKKEQYMEKLLPLTVDGKSTARKMEFPKVSSHETVAVEPQAPAEPEAQPEPAVAGESVTFEAPTGGSPAPQ
ncbi:MAG: S16 family serine protease, partial [Thermoplasmata archaeon]|nr:S16 family serine protease [Thermoplasmata archaeon]